MCPFLIGDTPAHIPSPLLAYEPDAIACFAALTCPELVPPENGYFVNRKCENLFNAACGVRCKPGYRRIGSSVRLCQDNATWSGSHTFCKSKD